MTEGNGHVIDPNGDARRALQEAVAEYGPEVLADPAAIDSICRDHLAGLPGESILIGDAVRTNVPALLSDLIPQLGNYGAIQSAAATLAGEHSLDMAASLWVVREFARALGYIAPATGAAAAFPGSGPRSVPGSGPRPVPGPGLAAGPGAAERPAGSAGATGAAEGGGTAGAESENASRGAGEAGRVAPGGAAVDSGAAGMSGAGPSGSGGGGGWGGGTGGAAPLGEPGFPLPLPAGRLPGGQPQRAKLLNRNTAGIAAAIALIAGYLGVAAVAHLSPFPAKTVPPAASSQSSSPPAGTRSAPASSPDPSADPTPSSQPDILLTKIPPAVRDQNNCKNSGTGFGATAVSQCQQLQGLGAGTILYYLYPSRAALAQGFSVFLKKVGFSKERECTTNGNFSDFLVECESGFTIKTPGMTGSIAEYVNSSRAQNPVIVSTDNEQDVMVIMVGTNDGDLLAYWNKLQWVVTS